MALIDDADEVIFLPDGDEAFDQPPLRVPLDELVAPAYRDTLHRAVSVARTAGVPWHFTYEDESADGSSSLYSSWVVRLPERVDNAELALLRVDLRRLGSSSNVALPPNAQALLEQQVGLVLIVDQDLTVRFDSRTPEAEPSSQPAWPTHADEQVRSAVARVFASGASSAAWWVRADAEAGSALFEWSAIPILGRAAVDAVMLVKRPAGLVERERRAARAEAEARGLALDGMGRVLGKTAHDFNNVLTVFVGCLELLSEEEVPSSARELIDELLEEVERATELTSSLLAVGQRQPLIAAEVEVRGLLREIAPAVREVVGSGASFVCEEPPEPLSCVVDRRRLVACVTKLISNAAKAIGDGGTVTLSARAVSAEAVADHMHGDAVRIEVRDDGVGMDPRLLSRAVEPFVTHGRKGRVRGLGLGEVRGFARQSGGTLILESAPGRGTVAALLLPREPRGGEASRRKTRSPVMVVHHEPDDRRYLGAVLERGSEYWVTEVPDVEGALRLLLDGVACSLVVAARALPPGTDGRSLAARIAELRPELPVLVVDEGKADSESPDGPFAFSGCWTPSGLRRAVSDAFEASDE